MEVTRSYVIRIYRQDPDALTGLMESVETGDVYAFRSVMELCDMLTRPPPLRRSTQSNSNEKEHGS